jgi:hypothetical protein
MRTSPQRRLATTAVLVRIPDAWERLRMATQAALELAAELEAVTRIRDEVMSDLHASGFSYRAIAQETALTRGRVAQIVRRVAADHDRAPSAGSGSAPQ